MSKKNYTCNTKLTERENEVKELFLQGFTNNQITEKFFVRYCTVRHY